MARLLLDGELSSLFTWGVSIFFIPSLALALGVWSGSRKLFEVVYTVLWYVGPLNNVPALDFIFGPASTGITFAMATLVMLAAATLGRHRHLRVA
jgi:hypothetical protein